VISVHVGADDVVDLLRPHAGVREALEKLAARRHVPVRARALLVVAHAGVDEDDMVTCAQQVRLHGKHEPVWWRRPSPTPRGAAGRAPHSSAVTWGKELPPRRSRVAPTR
jgi:hypothetical protein